MGRFKSTYFAGLLGTMAILALAGCGSSKSSSGSGKSTSSASKAPITILSINDLSGPAKVDGLAHSGGVLAAAAYFNAHGGIDGHKVIVQRVDDSSAPSTAVSILIQHLASSTPTMIDAGSLSSDAGALIPVLARHKAFAMALNDGNYQCESNASVTCPNEFTLSDAPVEPQLSVANWAKSKGFREDRHPRGGGDVQPGRDAGNHSGAE